MKKVSTIILVFLGILFFSTWQYRLMCLLGILYLWRSSMNTKVFKCLFGLSLLAFWMVLPDYIQRGRNRTYYIHDDFSETPFCYSIADYLAPVYALTHWQEFYERPPLPIYLWNAFFPEEEVTNIGIKLISFFPNLEPNLWGHRFGKELVKSVREDFWSWKIRDLYRPYEGFGNNPGSITIVQAWNEITGENHEAVTITTPKNFDKDKDYPLVIVAHGYMGCGDLYRGLMSELNNCIVLHVSTRDLNGIYTYDDIWKCLNRYLRMWYLEYNFSFDKIHFIGIGNGATGSDIALKYFSDQFASISYISAPCHFDGVTDSKVLMIGGGNDLFSKNLPSASEMLKKNGVDVSLLWDETENHLMFIHKTDQVIDFLKKELDL